MTTLESTSGRPLCRTEVGVDASDRMASLSFTTVARVTGLLPLERLRRALDQLEQRHVLLRAAIDRGQGELKFRWGAADSIPLREIHAPVDEVFKEAEIALKQRCWTDEGPRAELLVLRHKDDDCSLLLTLHHLISDGSSGIMLMRDLLAGVEGLKTDLLAQVDSPGLNAYVPERWRRWTAWFLMLGVAARSLSRFPIRLRQPKWRDDPARLIRLNALRLDEPNTRALCARAKADNVTVHGVIAAAMSQAVAASAGRLGLIRVMHAVNMRKQVSKEQQSAMLDQACGYYVSGMETDHQVGERTKITALAKEVHSALHQGLARGEPWLILPMLLPTLGAVVPKRGNVQRWAWFYERMAFRPSFGITNLGRLEAMKCHPQVGALKVPEFYFCAAGSVLYDLGLSVTHFTDSLMIVVNSQRARVSDNQAEHLMRSLQTHLLAYAQGH